MSTTLTRRASEVFASTDMDGNLRRISEEQTRLWGTEVETIAVLAATSSRAIPFATKGAMNANLSAPHDTSAWVLSDLIPGNNGIYKKSGAPGTGSWVRQGNIPVGLPGADGQPGEDGADGLNGAPGRVDAVGALTSRPVATAVPAGFVYVANDQSPNPLAYVSNGASWSEGFSVFANGAVLKAGDNSVGTLAFSPGATAVLGKAGTGNEAARASQIAEAINERRAPSRAVLKALDPTKVNEVYLTEYGREGQFLWRSGDWSSQIASDPLEGVYIKANGVPATDGAWIRQYNGGVSPRWFGALGNDYSDDYAALYAWKEFGGVGVWPGGIYRSSAPIDLTKFDVLHADSPVFKPTYDEGIGILLAYSPLGSFVENKRHYGEIRVLWQDRDWTKNRTSFFVQNAYNCRFEISSINATRGLHMHSGGLPDSTAGMGCVYNTIHLGAMFASQIGVHVTSTTSSGWTNANVYYDGYFYGQATAAQQAAGIYAGVASHIYVEGAPYANNGNHFVRPSLEWRGPGFRLARLGGYANTLRPRYTEQDNLPPEIEATPADPVWVHLFGTDQVLHWDTPSRGLHDPQNSASRVSIVNAVNPKIYSGNNYDERSHAVPDYLINTSPREVLRLQNKGDGPAAVFQVAEATKGLAIHSSSNTVLRTITGAGPEIINGGNNVVFYTTVRPTGTQYNANGFIWTYKQGDIAINVAPSIQGAAPNQYIIEGWACVESTNGTTAAKWVDKAPRIIV